MIKKKENCEYCGEKMESKTAKKRFCSEKCRVYYNREANKAPVIAETPKISIKTEKTTNNTKIPQAPENAKEMPKGLSIMDQIQWKIDNL
jgi:hypothetical protein